MASCGAFCVCPQAQYESPTPPPQVNATLYKARHLLDSNATSALTASADVATAMASAAVIIRDITNTFIWNSQYPFMMMGDVVDRVVRLAQVS